MTLFNEQMAELLALRASVKSLGEKLEASQAREAQLREYLTLALGIMPHDPIQDVAALLSKALALPTDDSALKARLKAERGRCAFHLESKMRPAAAEIIRNFGDEVDVPEELMK